MARVARLIVYDAPEENMMHQIAQSLPEGVHNRGNIKITVIDFGPSWSLDGFTAEEEHRLENFKLES